MNEVEHNLGKAASPFIRMHADDAIDWLTWSDETLKFAAEERKPVFLYIGTLSSMWSINMHKDTFNDVDTVNILSLYFTCIIVDREEHPELEYIYNNAVQAMTGKSGRPLSVFLTPEMRPFFGGTYFPAEDFQNLPALKTVLNNIATIWNNNPASLIDSAEKVSFTIEKNLKLVADLPQTGEEEENLEFDLHWPAFLYNITYSTLKNEFNDENKGFGKGSRFPHPEKISFLLRYFLATDHTEALDMVVSSLDKIAKSALPDQLAGGFHRYCIDEGWSRPIFEKHLAENAAIIKTYLEAYQVTESPIYENTIADALSFVLTSLTDDDTGAFFTSISSGNEEREADTYFWSHDELQKVVPEKDLALISDYYGLHDDADRALSIAIPLDKLAAKHEISEEDAEARIIEAKREMFKAREKKTQPLTDKKVLAFDNALMISTFAKAYGIMNEPGYLEAAKDAANFLLQNHFSGEIACKTWFDGEKGAPAQLDDYAATINALIDIYETDFDISMLEKARTLCSEMVSTFWNEKACVFRFCRAGTKILTDFVPFFDEGKPSAQALALDAAMRIAFFTNDKKLQQIVDSLIEAVKPTAFKLPQAMLYTIGAMYSKRCHNMEIAFSGDLESENGQALFNAVKYSFTPSATVVYIDNSLPDEIKANYPVLKNNPQIADGGKAAVHFCQDSICSEGLSDAETVEYILCPYTKAESED